MRTRDFNRLWEQLVSRHPETEEWSKAKMREEFNKLKESINEGRGKVLLTQQVRSTKATTARQQLLLAIKNSTTQPGNKNPEKKSSPIELALEASPVVRLSNSVTAIQQSTSLKCLNKHLPQLSFDNNEDDIPILQLKSKTKSKRQQSQSPDRDRVPMNLVKRKTKIGRRESLNQNNSVRKRRNRPSGNNNQSSNSLRTYRFVLEYIPTNKIVLLPEKTTDLVLKAHSSDQRPIDLTKKVPKTIIEDTPMDDDTLSAIDLTYDKWESTEIVENENEAVHVLRDENSNLSDQAIINMPSLESECNLEQLNNEPVIELDSSRSGSPYKTILNFFNDSITEQSAQLSFSGVQLESEYQNDTPSELTKDSKIPGQDIDDIENLEVEIIESIKEMTEIATIEQENECQLESITYNLDKQALNLSKLDQQTTDIVDTENIFEETNIVSIEQIEENMEIDGDSTERQENEDLVKIVQKIYSLTEEDISKDNHTYSNHQIESVEDNAIMSAILNNEEHNSDLEININENQLTFDTLLAADVELPFSEVSTLAFSSPAKSQSYSDEVEATGDFNLNEPTCKSDSTESIKSLCSRNTEDSLFYPSIWEKTPIRSDSSRRSINTEQTTVEHAKETENEQKLKIAEREDSNNRTNNLQEDFDLLNYPEVLDYEPDEENNDILSVATSWDGSLDEDLSTPVKNRLENDSSINESPTQPIQHLRRSPTIDVTLNPDHLDKTERRPFKIPKLKQNDQKLNTATTTSSLPQLDNDSNTSICAPNVPTLGRNRFTRNSLEEQKKILHNIKLRDADETNENAALHPSVAGSSMKRPHLSAAIASTEVLSPAGSLQIRRNSVPCVPQLARLTRLASTTLNNSQPNAGLMCSRSQLPFPVVTHNVLFPSSSVSVASSLQFSHHIPQPSINDKCVEIFGVTCFSHLDGRCKGSLECGRSHELHSFGEIQNKLFRLNQTDLRHAYLFVCRSKMLYQKFFPSFAIVFSNRHQTDSVLKMVTDCKLYPDCSSPFLKILYDSLLQCGLNQTVACEQIMSRCLDPMVKRWPNQLNSLVSIIMAAGWIGSLPYIAEICACREYKFPAPAMSTILEEVLLRDDPILTNRVAQIIMTISLDQYVDNLRQIKLLMIKLHAEFNGNSTEQHEELNPDYMSIFRENV